jgi:hypothetical protein
LVLNPYTFNVSTYQNYHYINSKLSLLCYWILTRSIFSLMLSFENVDKLLHHFRAIISELQTLIQTSIDFINFYIERFTNNALELPPHFGALMPSFFWPWTFIDLFVNPYTFNMISSFALLPNIITCYWILTFSMFSLIEILIK